MSLVRTIPPVPGYNQFFLKKSHSRLLVRPLSGSTEYFSFDIQEGLRSTYAELDRSEVLELIDYLQKELGK